jgi:hypothetical protein
MIIIMIISTVKINTNRDIAGPPSRAAGVIKCYAEAM